MGGMRRIAVVVLSLVAMAILIAALVAANAPGTVTAQADGEPTPFYETSDDPRLNAQMDHVEEATSILRDLEPVEPVTRALITRDVLLNYLVGTLDEDYPPELARDDAIFYHAFGLMDLDVDLRAIQLAVLAEQIAGFYEPELEAMFVISDGRLDVLDQIVYAHEFTHVLQDQHYDLIALGLDDERIAEQPDATLALLGLVEGDAMLMTEGYERWLMQSNPGAAFNLLGEGLLIGTEALNAAPAILYAELLFPYTEGRSFAYTLFMAGEGWDLVNEAYANPPRSTEHILHPERYLGGDNPIPAPITVLDDLLDADWRLVWDRVLGEFYLREHLRAVIPAEVANDAAAGWGGDRYLIYFNDETDETALVWRIVWDTTDDAAEFAAAYRGYGTLRFDAPGDPVGEGAVCWDADGAYCFYASDHETLVIMVPQAALVADVVALQSPLR